MIARWNRARANTVRPYLNRGQKTEDSEKSIVIPAQAGIQNSMHIAQFLDSRLRGNDGVDWADIRRFDARRREFVRFEAVEGETAEDDQGLCGVSSSGAQAILHSAIALERPDRLSYLSGLGKLSYTSDWASGDKDMTKTTNERAPDATALLSDLYQLVHDEQQAANYQLMTIWEHSLPEKLQKGLAQGFVRLERGPEPTTLWAYPDPTESRFREGDLLCLHQGNALEPLCRRLSFELEEDDRWLLRGNRATAIFDNYTGGACYADPDAMDLSGFYRQTLEDIGASVSGRETLLPLLSGQLDVKFDENDMMEAISVARAEGYNDKQAEAVGWAHGALHVACIQGPPGTGKTRVLSLIARLAVERGERILMTSHTHMAINNALNKIHAQGVPVVKVGRATQRKGLDEAIPNHEGLDGWEGRPTNGYVVGATPFATCTSRLENYGFDTILFDEASQITVPLALMAMRKGKRFIFIGDQRQLPPVLLSRSVLDKEAHSVFSRLTSRKAEHLVMLDETYRMNRWLTD
ncbi:MAG: AAA family ATPase, partial [Azoarcus sp.]|nr:AAA family ATPase [Azoarcus sp.]